MLCFARLIRCAIVASGTRNALAISAVVRPPTARSVSAIADGGVSAGWQHMKSRIERVVLIRAARPRRRRRRGRLLGPAASRRDRLSRRRRASLAAHVIGHAPDGDVDRASRADCRARPPRGHCVAAAISASCTASSAAAKSPIPPHDGAEHLRRQLAQQVLDAVGARAVPRPSHVRRRRAHHLPHLDRHVERRAARPGRGRRLARRSRTRARRCRRRRSRSRRGTPSPRGTGRRSRGRAVLRRAHEPGLPGRGQPLRRPPARRLPSAPG